MPRSHRLSPAAALIPVLILTAPVLAACGDRSGKVLDDPVFPPPATTVVATTLPVEVTIAAPLTLITPWVDGTPIPDRHTCLGVGTSPALTWSNVPIGTVELAISVVDLDADQFVHWLVYAVPPVTTGLVENQLPVGTFEWPNSSGGAAWFPPCPPAGATHRYEFSVYALNQQLEVADDASAAEVLSILNATTIARSSVTGLVSGAG